MLEGIKIENFKSIESLRIDFGRINVFIGENGCGKSNILEALAFFSAADANKMDSEFLSSRGIRVSKPELMTSAFSSNDKDIVTLVAKHRSCDDPVMHSMTNRGKNYQNWEITIPTNLKRELEKKPETQLILDKITKKASELLKEQELDIDDYIIENLKDVFLRGIMYGNDVVGKIDSYGKLKDFIIYSPENTALRNFYKEGQIEPLGINGEGLLKLLRVMSEEEPEKISIIKDTLKLLSWYEDLEIPTIENEKEGSLNIKDRYIADKLLDQASANEGFLFILFYITLIVSKDTPKVFAIDNIDASLNPKLCIRLMKDIAKLAEQFDKQILMTTHNPAILDGLDLNDPEQKLFVVSRNRKGATRAKEITVDKKPKSTNGEPLKLSDAMMRGYLGALPKGF